MSALRMKVKGKVFVVTGAGSGIGRELVLELLRRGASVGAIDINAKTLAETLSLAGERATSLATFTVDVSDAAAVAAFPRKVVEKFGAVDGVINCAGIIQPFVSVSHLDLAVIERVFDVNWRGTLLVTKALLPLLRERPEASIVNVSSMGGFFPFPGQTLYGASKAAVKLFTEGLRAELARTRICVSVALPGAVATNIMANSGVTLGVSNDDVKILSADRAAREILNGVERKRFRILVGVDSKVLDFLYRVAPEWTPALVAWKMRSLIPQVLS